MSPPSRDPDPSPPRAEVDRWVSPWGLEEEWVPDLPETVPTEPEHPEDFSEPAPFEAPAVSLPPAPPAQVRRVFVPQVAPESPAASRASHPPPEPLAADPGPAAVIQPPPGQGIPAPRPPASVPAQGVSHIPDPAPDPVPDPAPQPTPAPVRGPAPAELAPPRAPSSQSVKSFADYGSLSAAEEPSQRSRKPAAGLGADDSRFRPPGAAATTPGAVAAAAAVPAASRTARSPGTAPASSPQQDRQTVSSRGRGRSAASWLTSICLSLGLLGMTFLLWIYLRDVPLRSDEDLRIPFPVDQAPAISAPDRLQTFLKSITRLENPELASLPPWSWDTPSLSAFVSANGRAFDNLRDLLEDFDWHPHHAAWHARDLGEPAAWRDVSRILQAQAAYLARRGEEEQAFTSAMDLAELSRRLQELWAWPSFMLRSQEIHTSAVQLIAELLKQTRLDNARLRPFQEEFIRCQPADAALQGAFNGYYIHEKKLLLGPASGQPLDTMPGGLLRPRPGRLFFKVNETLALFASAFRNLKDEVVAAPYAALGPVSQPLRRVRQTAPQFYQPNGAGERYFSDHIDPYLQMPRQHSLARARQGLVLCLFAFRRHLADHQRLPAGLSELEGPYLTKVPTDPFSGEPIQFDGLRGLLYSVGTNLLAEGGRPTQPPLADPKEPTVELGIAIAAPVKPSP